MKLFAAILAYQQQKMYFKITKYNSILFSQLKWASSPQKNENGNCLNIKGLDIKNSLAFAVSDKKQQAAVGFEPTNNGFANRRLRPLGYAAISTRSII